MHADMTAVTYNLTKLFRMKLKTSATRAILRRKPNETFGQPSICLLPCSINDISLFIKIIYI